jgi:hypothetical protein
MILKVARWSKLPTFTVPVCFCIPRYRTSSRSVLIQAISLKFGERHYRMRNLLSWYSSASVFPGRYLQSVSVLIQAFSLKSWGTALQNEKPTTLVPSASVFPGRYPQSVSAYPGFQPQIWGTAVLNEKPTTVPWYRLLLYSGTSVHPYIWITDQDPYPALFLSDFQDTNKNKFFV